MTDILSLVGGKAQLRGTILVFTATCVAYLRWLKYRLSLDKCEIISTESEESSISIYGAGAEDWEEEEESKEKYLSPKNRRVSFYPIPTIAQTSPFRADDRGSDSDLHYHFQHPNNVNPTPLPYPTNGEFRLLTAEEAETSRFNWSGVHEKANDNLVEKRNRIQRRLSMTDYQGESSTNCRQTEPNSVLPKRLIMIRHGESEGNINQNIYSIKPDNAVRLTNLGWDQANESGNVLKNHVLGQDEPVHFILSPYVRTTETLHGLLAAWCDPEKEFGHISDLETRKQAWYDLLQTKYKVTWHEDPRIREQDFGNYQDPVAMRRAKKERHKFGAFYYRFPHGESASDVYDRVSTFLDSLWRSFHAQRSQNYVIVTHGISIRVLLSRYFRYTIDQFHTLANPKNCEMVILGHDGYGKLQLNGRCELELVQKQEIEEEETNCDDADIKPPNKNANFDIRDSILCPDVRRSICAAILFKTTVETTHEVVGFKFYQKLRTLPPEYISKRKIRISRPD